MLNTPGYCLQCLPSEVLAAGQRLFYVRLPPASCHASRKTQPLLSCLTYCPPCSVQCILLIVQTDGEHSQHGFFVQSSASPTQVESMLQQLYLVQQLYLATSFRQISGQHSIADLSSIHDLAHSLYLRQLSDDGVHGCAACLGIRHDCPALQPPHSCFTYTLQKRYCADLNDSSKTIATWTQD
jgi:hypothetical protein